MATILAAIITGLLALPTGVLLTWLTIRWREANPQLSYVLEAFPIVAAEHIGRVHSQVLVSIKGREVARLHSCKLTFRNTGNQLLEAVQLCVRLDSSGKLIHQDVQSICDSQLGSMDVIEPADQAEELEYRIGHLLRRDRFALEFLAADADPGDIEVFVFQPPVHLREVRRLETPGEQVREAFRSDPVRFSFQLIAPLIAAGGALAAGLLTALLSDPR